MVDLYYMGRPSVLYGFCCLFKQTIIPYKMCLSRFINGVVVYLKRDSLPYQKGF